MSKRNVLCNAMLKITDKIPVPVFPLAISDGNTLPEGGCSGAGKTKQDCVYVLSEPRQYYKFILSGIANAQRRIVASSLYLGTEDLERQIVVALRDCLQRVQQLPPDGAPFKAYLLFDYFRGTRGMPNTASLFQPLITEFGSKERASSPLNVSFFATSLAGSKGSRLRSFLPRRLNELPGVHHMKFFVFDNDVLVTGANMGKDYFTNRQDRYIVIQGHDLLASYFDELSCSLARYGYSLKSSNDAISSQQRAASYHQPDEWQYSTIGNWLAHWTKRHSPKAASKADADTFVIPFLQIPSLGIRQNEQIFRNLLKWCEAIAAESEAATFKMTLATGYFNLDHSLRSAIINSQFPWSIYTASPRANGFYESAGISRYIPDLYRASEYSFLQQLQANEADLQDSASVLSQKKLFEYERSGWTFHTKGFWAECDSLGISATIVGSSNFGQRSKDRDSENQLLIITTNPSLREKLKIEIQNLSQHSTQVDCNTLEKESCPRQIPRLLYPILSSYL